MKIKLNNEIGLDLEKLVSTKLLVQANSGGGKSWIIRRILEQSHGKIQHIILDPEGEFATLREKFDYILVGKEGDIPATIQGAALLAHKLLELKVSAVIDLFELLPQDRKRFVKLFLDAMINAPKNLWHDCLVVLDEAHNYAPEKGESEALSAVAALASLGRKRRFGAIFATQRISKFNKDVAAECNNKLIGRTGLDIDMKRAADELGFSGKDQALTLRSLAPGHFYAFGPAISNEVITLEVGGVQTAHEVKIGNKKLSEVVPPTQTVKKALEFLANLPQEAKKHAQTMDELRKENAELKRQNTGLLKNPFQKDKTYKQGWDDGIAAMETTMRRELNRQVSENKKEYEKMRKAIHQVEKIVRSFVIEVTGKPIEIPRNPTFQMLPPTEKRPRFEVSPKQEPVLISPIGDLNDVPLGKGELAILTAIAQHEDGISREHLTVLTGYKRSSRDAYMQRLQAKGLIFIGVTNKITDKGREYLGDDFEPLPTGEALREHLMKTLPQGEKKILEVLIEVYPEAVERDNLTSATGYQRSSRDAYLQRLSARQLVEFQGRGMVKAVDKLFE